MKSSEKLEKSGNKYPNREKLSFLQYRLLLYAYFYSYSFTSLYKLIDRAIDKEDNRDTEGSYWWKRVVAMDKERR